MKNFTQRGNVISVIAPYALASGDGFKVGAFFGVACGSAAAGTSVEMSRRGVFELKALNTDAGVAGARIYWDDSNRRLTTTLSGNILVGCLTEAKSNGQSTAAVLLDGALR